MDKRVIDIPFLLRWFLVNVIIATFRSPKSAAEYRKLFDDRGAPLIYHTEDLLEKVRELISEEYVVEYAMRYQNPSLEVGLKKLMDQNVSGIHVIPLFPQYASATTGSVIDKVMEITSKWQVIPNIKFTSQFLEDEMFLETIAQNAKAMMKEESYDHFLFSYHGIPERQIKKASVDNYCKLGKCCNTFHARNRFCYRAQCFETSRLLAAKLGLNEDQYTVSFQSRLGKDPWIQPYTEEKVVELAKNGMKKVLAFSPAFVADCLETTIEVGETYQEDFIREGGEKWDLVPSLNSDDKWARSIVGLVENKKAG